MSAVVSPMIVSIGIDIVEVYRIREAIARTPRFAERVFTERERQYCAAKGRSAAQSFAGRFAAKEAFLKAIKTGWRGKVSWQDIEVMTDDFGAPSLSVKGEARRWVETIGAEQMHVTISHTDEHAVAQVILERT